MQGTTVGRDGHRRRGAAATGALVAGSVLGLVLTLSGCGPLSAERSAAPSATLQDVQVPDDPSTDASTNPAATGPIPTITAEPLTPVTPTATASSPTATTSAPTPAATTDPPATVTPVTAPPTPAQTTPTQTNPTQTELPGTAAGSCARTLTAYPVLEPGAKGAAVRALQCFLGDDGYGPVAVDGVYGPETRAAVRRAEATLKSPPPHPGRIDAGRWVLLISRSLGRSTLRTGSTGPDVVTLQRALRAAGATVPVDGRFGAQTKKAVQRLQAANRIAADGIVNDETLSLLKNGATIG